MIGFNLPQEFSIAHAREQYSLPDWLPDHSPAMWGWHKTDTNVTGDDLVSLLPFDDYINDPTLIVALMEQEGVTGVDSVEVDGQQGGGTSPNKYQGYIHWSDGTQSKTVIKGRRPSEFATASYREALFYSRITEPLMSSVKSPGSYLAVADVGTGDCLYMEEFMSDYVSLEDVFTKWATGNLSDLGINPDDFDMVETQKLVFSTLGHFSGSNWNNDELKKEFWMKQYDEAVGHGHYDEGMMHLQTAYMWKQYREALVSPRHPMLHVSDNTLACMDAIFDAWTYQNVTQEWESPSYNWGLTHGDFHSGQVMINPSNLTDMIMLDWEFTGIMGNPAIDMASWIALVPPSFAEAHEEDMVRGYWQALIEEGVDPEEYTFEQLWSDYGIYGAGQMFSRFIYFGGLTPTSLPVEVVTRFIDAFFTRHNLTPDMMKAPMYGCVDDYV